eukprot:353244-Chlamydomonas_euryale.AAC.10
MVWSHETLTLGALSTGSTVRGRSVSKGPVSRTHPRHFCTLAAEFPKRFHCVHASPGSVVRLAGGAESSAREAAGHSAILAPEACQRSAGERWGPSRKLSPEVSTLPDSSGLQQCK